MEVNKTSNYDLASAGFEAGVFNTSYIASLVDVVAIDAASVKAKNALKLLKSCKDPQFKVPFIEQIELKRKAGFEVDRLVACCWESGLDYSPFVRYFAMLIARGTEAEALEALTVVQEFSQADKSEIEASVSILLQGKEMAPDLRSIYLQDALNHLTELKNNK